jgi:FkbM family methyltransferase
MYSQNNEEEIILAYLNNCKDGGRFLDIGASDGRSLSNTLALAERGWSGVCVEPSPIVAAKLRSTHIDRPTVMCIEAAITEQDGPIDLHDTGGYWINTTDPEMNKKWNVAKGVPSKIIRVCGLTLATLIRHVGLHFSFVNIDVEGGNLGVAQQLAYHIDSGAMSPRIMCIEHDEHIPEILAMFPKYRELARNPENLILAK